MDKITPEFVFAITVGGDLLIRPRQHFIYDSIQDLLIADLF